MGTHIAIPHKKHQATLNLIHEGHLGLNKCKLRAKDTVYWPGLNEQLEKLVLNFELCLKYSHSKCKQKPSTSLGQEIPLHTWTKPLTFFTLKVHPICWYWTIQADFQLSASCLQWQVYMLQTNASKYRWVPLKPDFLGAWKSAWLISNPVYQY